ncbi:MAG TPA: hypothetical protein VLV87_04125 [Gammaproteobacteria bacterium]|nr:hypothetical protein [Gammaproteobacteria bacterium]
MAINRILNAMWAEISARGSLIKAATNPYNPTPGGDVPGANNQGLAAIQSSSPFIQLNRDGVSSQFPVNTALGNEGRNSPTPLDENSGAYHVVRQYGDIYLFNDGNVVAWGGNGKNFSFGNGYEENHAWAGQACVYNNEVFTIPAGAMSTPGCFSSAPNPSPTAVAEYEWLGGNVSKSWGNDYTYTYGASYEWSGGPTTYIDAYGNSGNNLTDVMQGKHCTFSYGNGYEEALIEWTPSSTWFHADDPNSPYKSRTSDSWTSSNLGTSWSASSLLVSKAFGPTYDYHYGSAKSVQEGPSEEVVNGASWSTVTGDSTETVNGNSTSTVTGDSTETVHGNATSNSYGNATETHWGTSDEYFMGGKNEMMLAGCDEINLAAKLEIVGGAATEIYLGAKLEIVMAVAMELKGGLGLSITTGENVEMNLGKVEIEDTTQIDVKTSQITAAVLNLFC